jgi:hypothetical protein
VNEKRRHAIKTLQLGGSIDAVSSPVSLLRIMEFGARTSDVFNSLRRSKTTEYISLCLIVVYSLQSDFE